MTRPSNGNLAEVTLNDLFGGHDMITDIRNFHEKYKLAPLQEPGFLPQELMSFRLKFLLEELTETMNAVEAQDLEETFDGLIDLIYVALGTLYLMRCPTALGWREVHSANMEKIRAQRADQSKRSSTFDVVKPEGWQKPKMLDILNAALLFCRREELKEVSNG